MPRRALPTALTTVFVTPVALGVLVLGPVPAADAAPKPKSYANCTALNHDYPHGVGTKKAKDHVSGKTKPVTTFTRSDTVYGYNDGGSKRRAGEKDLDRDNDGVACEKR